MRKRKKPLGNRNRVGARVTEVRRARGWKQKDVLIRLQLRGINMGEQALSNLEGQSRGVSAEELRALAEVFGVAMEELCAPEEDAE